MIQKQPEVSFPLAFVFIWTFLTRLWYYIGCNKAKRLDDNIKISIITEIIK